MYWINLKKREFGLDSDLRMCRVLILTSSSPSLFSLLHRSSRFSLLRRSSPSHYLISSRAYLKSVIITCCNHSSISSFVFLHFIFLVQVKEMGGRTQTVIHFNIRKRVNNWIEAEKIWRSMQENGYIGTRLHESLILY
ncbi:hypothetical protein Q3G72_034786 [Acer saccharum]|nr:hypothetical protein Q3G72_034786 [Acer saccharum]